MPQMKGFLSTVLTSCLSTSGFFFSAPGLGAAAGSTGGKPTSSGLSRLRVYVMCGVSNAGIPYLSLQPRAKSCRHCEKPAAQHTGNPPCDEHKGADDEADDAGRPHAPLPAHRLGKAARHQRRSKAAEVMLQKCALLQKDISGGVSGTGKQRATQAPALGAEQT